MRSLPSSTIAGFAELAAAGVGLLAVCAAYWAGLASESVCAGAAGLLIGKLAQGAVSIALPQHAAPPPPVTAADTQPAGVPASKE